MHTHKHTSTGQYGGLGRYVWFYFLFCRYTGLHCGYIGLFREYIGLFGGNTDFFCRLTMCNCQFIRRSRVIRHQPLKFSLCVVKTLTLRRCLNFCNAQLCCLHRLCFILHTNSLSLSHTHTQTHKYIHMHTYTCTHTHTHAKTCSHTHTHAHSHTCTCTHTHAHTHTPTHTRTHTHTHMHTGMNIYKMFSQLASY